MTTGRGSTPGLRPFVGLGIGGAVISKVHEGTLRGINKAEERIDAHAQQTKDSLDLRLHVRSRDDLIAGTAAGFRRSQSGQAAEESKESTAGRGPAAACYSIHGDCRQKNCPFHDVLNLGWLRH